MEGITLRKIISIRGGVVLPHENIYKTKQKLNYSSNEKSGQHTTLIITQNETLQTPGKYIPSQRGLQKGGVGW